ncbi:MAG: clostripain-related cysteine peptidase [Lachnospiraceae bacterium]|nr:clostripain-related cysteine peptidase [Lachnospiraceae bacterium]
MFCSSCGKPVDEHLQICNHCGASLSASHAAVMPANLTAPLDSKNAMVRLGMVPGSVPVVTPQQPGQMKTEQPGQVLPGQVMPRVQPVQASDARFMPPSQKGMEAGNAVQSPYAPSQQTQLDSYAPQASQPQGLNVNPLPTYQPNPQPTYNAASQSVPGMLPVTDTNPQGGKGKVPGWLIAVIAVGVVLLGGIIGMVVYLINDGRKEKASQITIQTAQTNPTGDETGNGINEPDDNVTPQPSQGGSTDVGGDSEISLADNAIREPQVQLKGDGTDTVTVMIYINGSNLESEYGEATTDMAEMVKAGSSDQVNVIVETVGTKKWQNYGISSKRSQIYKLNGSGLTLLKDDLGQCDATDGDTLANFIKYSAANYPADRYILLMWDHGGGPVYGFGYDEYNEDGVMAVDEMKDALASAGVYFDFIGMDCCIMSCLETCIAFYDYCDYAVLSEDFESGLGWNYTRWMKALYDNPSIPTPDLGKIICDDMVQANEDDAEEGDDSILCVIDEGKMKLLCLAWMDFAYANEEDLLENNYSQERSSRGRVMPSLRMGGRYDDEPYMSEYYIVDIMALANQIDTPESQALASAIASTIIYCASCGDDDTLTGMAVTLPYGDRDFYYDMEAVFTHIGMDSAYIAWLQKFVEASGSSNYYDYDDWDFSWDEYEDDYDWDDWDIDWDSWGSDDDDCYYYDDDDDWDSFWDSLFEWDDWDYDDSYNEWYDEDDWSCDDEDSWYYEGDEDNWFWDDWDDWEW